MSDNRLQFYVFKECICTQKIIVKTIKTLLKRIQLTKSRCEKFYICHRNGNKDKNNFLNVLFDQVYFLKVYLYLGYAIHLTYPHIIETPFIPRKMSNFVNLLQQFGEFISLQLRLTASAWVRLTHPRLFVSCIGYVF